MGMIHGTDEERSVYKKARNVRNRIPKEDLRKIVLAFHPQRDEDGKPVLGKDGQPVPNIIEDKIFGRVIDFKFKTIADIANACINDGWVDSSLEGQSLTKAVVNGLRPRLAEVLTAIGKTKLKRPLWDGRGSGGRSLPPDTGLEDAADALASFLDEEE